MGSKPQFVSTCIRGRHPRRVRERKGKPQKGKERKTTERKGKENHRKEKRKGKNPYISPEKGSSTGRTEFSSGPRFSSSPLLRVR